MRRVVPATVRSARPGDPMSSVDPDSASSSARSKPESLRARLPISRALMPVASSSRACRSTAQRQIRWCSSQHQAVALSSHQPRHSRRQPAGLAGRTPLIGRHSATPWSRAKISTDPESAQRALDDGAESGRARRRRLTVRRVGRSTSHEAPGHLYECAGALVGYVT